MIEVMPNFSISILVFKYRSSKMQNRAFMVTGQANNVLSMIVVPERVCHQPQLNKWQKRDVVSIFFVESGQRPLKIRGKMSYGKVTVKTASTFSTNVATSWKLWLSCRSHYRVIGLNISEIPILTLMRSRWRHPIHLNAFQICAKAPEYEKQGHPEVKHAWIDKAPLLST